MTEQTAAEKTHLGDMEAFVAHAAALATTDLAPKTEARIAALAQAFDVAVAGLPPAPLTVVIYHLKLPDATRAGSIIPACCSIPSPWPAASIPTAAFSM